jgi:methyl-accepting chemotaxis protein
MSFIRSFTRPKFKSLRFRILAFGGCPVLITILIISSVLVQQQYKELLRNSVQEIDLNTSHTAEQLERDNLESVTIPKIMAVAQENGLFGNREQSIKFAKRVLELNPKLTGAYFGYEPNADSQVLISTNKLSETHAEAVDGEGRFLPYWFRDQDDPDLIKLAPLADMETSFYYQGVKNRETGAPETEKVALSSELSRYYIPQAAVNQDPKIMITEPYVYEGKLIFEHTYPITIDNKFAGIAGVDRALTDVNTFLNNLKPYETAGYILISRRGRIITSTFDSQMNTKRIEDSRLNDILRPFYEMQNNAEMVVAEDPKDNAEYFYDSAKIPTGQWTLVMRVSKDEIYAPLRAQLKSLISFSVGGLLFTIIVLLWLSDSIANRVSLAERAAEQVARGDLTGKVEVSGEDETGQLLQSITTMTGNLNGLIGQVKQSSIQLTSTATKISANAKTQESAVNEFGSSTTQIAAAVKEISATSRELSKTMNDVTEGASETAHLADAGREGLIEMETAMSTLASANKSISSKLAIISERAKNINSVVTTISKVADQTNLLSLNAAIEAEKAGEYGLGFSVVAREVRRLADQTAVATLDIDQMVKEMQSSVSAGVMEMDKFTEHMRQGTDNVHNLSSQLGLIIEHVQQLTERFETVTHGMNTQADGAQQINSAMIQLTDAARSTSTSIGAFNQATSDLRDAVGGLREEVTKFKVE